MNCYLYKWWLFFPVRNNINWINLFHTHKWLLISLLIVSTHHSILRQLVMMPGEPVLFVFPPYQIMERELSISYVWRKCVLSSGKFSCVCICAKVPSLLIYTHTSFSLFFNKIAKDTKKWPRGWFFAYGS